MNPLHPGIERGGGDMTRTQWLKIGVVGVLAVLMFVIIALNIQSVTVHLLVAKTEMPLVVLLLITLLAGMAIGWAVSYVLRQKR